MNRFAELTRARAFHGLTEMDCQTWFGVGIATLERIEAGEVEPGDELDQRINRFLNYVGGSLSPNSRIPSLPGASLTHGGAPNGAGGGAPFAPGVRSAGGAQ